MERKEFSFTDPAGLTIHCYKWTGNVQPKAIVQIVHGMAEHALRYDNFACFLTDHGFAVYANDHRGHGLTAGTFENTGYLADHDGWEIATNNVFQLTTIIKKEYKGIPVFLLGHSMGSLLARNYMINYPDSVNGVILSGTSFTPSFLLMFGKVVANLQRLFAGKKHRSKLLNTLSFGSFNKRFKPVRTKFDWLSRDDKQVDLYINDKFCGFVCTTTFFADMFKGIMKIQKNSHIMKTSTNLPVNFISGELDAVGNFTKGVKKVTTLLRKNGVTDVEIKFYHDARHEILNEINKEDVYNDIVEWINNKMQLKLIEINSNPNFN